MSFNKIVSYVLKKKKSKGRGREEVLKIFLKQHHLKGSVQFNKVHKHMLLLSKRTLTLLGFVVMLLIASVKMIKYDPDVFKRVPEFLI